NGGRNVACRDLPLCTGCGSDRGASVGLWRQGVGAIKESVLGRPDCLANGSFGACLDRGDAHRGDDGRGARGTMEADSGGEADAVVAAGPFPSAVRALCDDFVVDASGSASPAGASSGTVCR